MSKRKFRTINEIELEYYTKHPEEIKDYLEAALEEYQKDGNERAFLSSLALITKINGGFTKISQATGLNREHLYRALSSKGNPRFSTIIQILHSLGLNLKVA
jgi:probable addiction module antidote protein